ncbi:MAG: glycosyltransferase family 2 protein [Patescibacteria group bacterium]|nr:glycosyltransferase family 2 protein [Patescibacteria group bacterium]
MELSIIVINYETPKLLGDLLNSLENVRNQEELDFEVILVNVTPDDGSKEMVEENYSRVNQIIDTRNLGFSGNNNIGLKEASGRYVLFLNSDTTVPEGTLPEMLNFMETNQDVGAATCYVELLTGGMDPDCHRGFPTPWASLTYFLGLEKLFPQSKLFGQYHQFYKDLTKTHEIDACAGAFLLMPRAVGEEIDLRKIAAGETSGVRSAETPEVGECGDPAAFGTSNFEFGASSRGARPVWWNEDFFFYGEDLDLCWRIKEAGYKVVFYPHVKIIHYKGASSGLREESKNVTTASEETRKRLLPETTRAMRLFYKKHYKDKYPWVVSKLVYLGVGILEKIRTKR